MALVAAKASSKDLPCFSAVKINKVVVPKKLKENQKEALLNYANVSGEDVTQYKGKGSWLDKIIDKIKSC